MRSDDGGANWQEINSGLPSRDVTALALHSFQRETLFAWLKDEGIYRTEDGGGSMNTGWLYAATPSGAYLSIDCF
jgi:hypothetical protein